MRKKGKKKNREKKSTKKNHISFPRKEFGKIWKKLIKKLNENFKRNIILYIFIPIILVCIFIILFISFNGKFKFILLLLSLLFILLFFVFINSKNENGIIKLIELIFLGVIGTIFSLYGLSQSEKQSEMAKYQKDIAEQQTTILNGQYLLDKMDMLKDFSFEYEIKLLSKNPLILSDNDNIYKILINNNKNSKSIIPFGNNDNKDRNCNIKCFSDLPNISCQLSGNDDFTYLSQGESKELELIINYTKNIGIQDIGYIDLKLNCNFINKELNEQYKEFIPLDLSIGNNLRIKYNISYLKGNKILLIDSSGKIKEINHEVKNIRKIIVNKGGKVKSMPTLITTSFSKIVCENISSSKENCFLIVGNNESCDLIGKEIKDIYKLKYKFINFNSDDEEDLIQRRLFSYFYQCKKYPSLYQKKSCNDNSNRDNIDSYGFNKFYPFIYKNFKGKVDCIIFWPQIE